MQPSGDKSHKHSFVAPRRTEAAKKVLTHETIEAHLAAFERAGGQVEVLGPTPVFKHIGLQAKPPAKE